MRLYHEIRQEAVPFETAGDEVLLYICGVTPYDTTHLGHAFTYASFDVLIRYLEYQGYSVRYVQNVTDIDDDILRKAGEVGDDWRALGDRWTAHFIRDMQSLNVRPPDFFPRATEVVTDIVDAVQRLLEEGVAYESGGNVYYHIDAWPQYGELSRIPRTEMLPIANERGNFPDDANKKDPLDFVLWQAQKPGEPAWDSPWGPGRPGWHIECSTMAGRFLGATIDFHGGGGDLIYPHHESEIAQAEAATGQKPFVRFWFHTAMVYHEGEKMSKSLGNLVMIDELLKTWSADGIRIYLGKHHYRAIWSHDDDELAHAEKAAETIRAAVMVPGGAGTPMDPAEAKTAFLAAMDDDLNAPQALAVLEDMAEQVLEAAEARRNVEEAQRTIRELAQIFGLRLDRSEPEERVINGWNRHLQKFVSTTATSA
ncbi:MAG: cysteine--tRNA ligase [Chloroflexi bacterium]|nr:cysteine--tRNA ligase [Chloroflexota bacterium]